MKNQILSEEFRRMQEIAGIITESNNTETPELNPKMQKKFDMMVNALKKAKSEDDVDWVYNDLQLLPTKNLRKIFFDKLVSVGRVKLKGNGNFEFIYGDK